MTRRTYNLSLRDRNLIRLKRHMRIENFHAQRMAQNGDVELYEMEVDLELFAPSKIEGMCKIRGLSFVEKGNVRINELLETYKPEFDAYQAECQVGHYAHQDEQIIYTGEASYTAIMSVERDQFFALNQKISRDTERKVRARSIDPDTYEVLISEAEIQAMDLYDDDGLPLKYK